MVPEAETVGQAVPVQIVEEVVKAIAVAGVV